MNKIKGCRRIREDDTNGRKVELAPKYSDEECASYHSHHRLIPDSLPTQLSNQKSKNLLAPGSVQRADRLIPSKTVVFSSKTLIDHPTEDTPRKQSLGIQAKASNEKQNISGAKRKPLTYASKLVQTSSSISDNVVSFRSIGVGVSEFDLCRKTSYRTSQSRPSLKSACPVSPSPSRRSKPGSSATINSAWYTRTSSSVLAGQDVPPVVSHRHIRCLLDPTYLPPIRKSKKSRPNSNSSKDTAKRKQTVIQAKTKIS